MAAAVSYALFFSRDFRMSHERSIGRQHLEPGSKYPVHVLDRDGVEMAPCRAVRARILISKGRARVISTVPFTIMMLRKEDMRIWKR